MNQLAQHEQQRQLLVNVSHVLSDREEVQC